MNNYIKDVQEGGIIDPGHVREMNMLAYLGTLPEFDVFFTKRKRKIKDDFTRC